MAPERSRYPALPSWAVDHTIYERKELCATFGFLHVIKETAMEMPRDRDKTQKWDFEGDFFKMRGRFIDGIELVGNANVDEASDNFAVTHQQMMAVHTWRHKVLERHSLGDSYILPTGYTSKSKNWTTAWVRMICGGHHHFTVEYSELTAEETQIVLADAGHAPANVILLDFAPTFRGYWDDADFERVKTQMARPDLYEQVSGTASDILKNNRMLISQADYLGFGNQHIRPGDKIFLTARCGRPLILRPVEGSLEKHGRQTYRHISICYLEGFMQGPDEGVTFPFEEVWVE